MGSSIVGAMQRAVHIGWRAIREKFGWRSLVASFAILVVAAIAVSGFKYVSKHRGVSAAANSTTTKKDQLEVRVDASGSASDSSELKLRVDNLSRRVDHLTQLSAMAAVQPGARRPPSGSLIRATLRDLPFPFTRYFTIASDADSMSFDRARHIYATLSNQLLLPLSDSTFVDQHFVQESKRSSDFKSQTSDAAAQHAGMLNSSSQRLEFLQWYNSGLVDTMHGFNVVSLYRQSGSAVLQIAPEGPAAVRASLKLVDTVAYDSLPFDLIFKYTLPLSGTVKLNILNETGESIWNSTLDLPSRVTPTNVVVPLKGLALQAGARDLVLNIELIRPYPYSRATFEGIAITNFNRSRTASNFLRAKGLNMMMPVFTDHAFPPIGGLGLEDLHAAPHRVTWAKDYLGDNPESPAYWIDLFDLMGGEFILTANRTSKFKTLFPIQELTYPFLFNDGRWRYSFNRLFVPVPEAKNASLEDHIGEQIAGSLAMADASKSGSGGVLYTHWGVGYADLTSPRSATPEKAQPLSQSTFESLKELSARYYGMKDGVPLTGVQRVWVAPTYRVLTYSNVRRQIEPHIDYDPVANEVHIERWGDPVLARPQPPIDRPLKKLQGITVYVEKSATARAFIDGVELKSFTRNPADETGRESIGFVDDSTPSLIFDEVDLTQQAGSIVQKDAMYFLRRNDAYSGSRSLEVTLRGAEGEVEWRPDSLSCVRADAFQFAVRKSKPSVSVSLILTAKDGVTYEFTEAAFSRKTSGLGAVFDTAQDDSWVLRTIDFAQLDFRALGRIAVPWQAIQSVRFVVRGERGDFALFDRVACLRQNPLDDPDDGFLIAGVIDFGDLDKKTAEVVLDVDGQLHQMTVDESGVFIFEKKVRRGHVAMVYAVGGPNLDKYFPVSGRRFQVEGNVVDLKIRMTKDMHPPDLAGSVPPEEVGSTTWLPGVGITYRPFSRYVTTGLSRPTEFRTEHLINNLGYVDRMRRPEKPAGLTRILLMGICTTFGHTEPLFYQASQVMEGLLEQRLQREFEVMNMSSGAQSAGLSYFYFDKLARAYKPDIVAVELIGPYDVAMSDPKLSSVYTMSDEGHLPHATFRERPDGTLEPQPADPLFANFAIKDPAKVAAREAEVKDSPFIVDGIDMRYLFHREPSAPYTEQEQHVFTYYEKLLKTLKSEFEKAGARVIFVVNDLFGSDYVYPLLKGVKHQRENFTPRMLELCRRAEVNCVMFTPTIYKQHTDITQRFWRRDSHYSRVGYRWYAESMVDYLQETEMATKGPKIWPVEPRK